MIDAGGFWQATDGVGRAVALVLLAMSVTSWALLGWKAWLLRRARRGLTTALPAFWAASALFCEATAKASCCSRVICHCLATFSAVMPM